jgi:uncharacterized protein YhbP (UPF0306 family)
MAVNVEQRIRDYLPGIRHMTLATAGENGWPWATELDFVAGDDLTLCFRSLVTRGHSQNIARDPRVAGTIVRTHEVGAPVEGVSFVGTVALLEAGPERDEYAELFVAQLGAQPDIVERAAAGGPQFYAVDVATWSYYGAEESSRPQTYELPWNQPLN